MTLSRCKCQKALFAAIAQNFGRQGLHFMTACIRSAHEGCGTRHITVVGAGNDRRNALAVASDGVHRRQSRALSVASRDGVSLQTQNKCGFRQLRLAIDWPGPGKQQERRGGELGAGSSASWHFTRSQRHTWTLQPLSSPPRLLCRSPGPGASVASLRCLNPHLSRVFKLTPARDATERARDCPGGPHPRRLRGHSGGHHRRHRP